MRKIERAGSAIPRAASASAADFDHPALRLQLPSPSVAEMRRRLASVPVVNAGPTWVLFDLRALKDRASRFDDLTP